MERKVSQGVVLSSIQKIIDNGKDIFSKAKDFNKKPAGTWEIHGVDAFIKDLNFFKMQLEENSTKASEAHQLATQFSQRAAKYASEAERIADAAQKQYTTEKDEADDLGLLCEVRDERIQSKVVEMQNFVKDAQQAKSEASAKAAKIEEQVTIVMETLNTDIEKAQTVMDQLTKAKTDADTLAELKKSLDGGKLKQDLEKYGKDIEELKENSRARSSFGGQQYLNLQHAQDVLSGLDPVEFSQSSDDQHLTEGKKKKKKQKQPEEKSKHEQISEYERILNKHQVQLDEHVKKLTEQHAQVLQLEETRKDLDAKLVPFKKWKEELINEQFFKDETRLFREILQMWQQVEHGFKISAYNKVLSDAKQEKETNKSLLTKCWDVQSKLNEKLQSQQSVTRNNQSKNTQREPQVSSPTSQRKTLFTRFKNTFVKTK